MIMNKSILAWLYYNKLYPDRYDNIDDSKQKDKAERALNNCKTVKVGAFMEAIWMYNLMLHWEIEELLKSKSPKPEGKGE